VTLPETDAELARHEDWIKDEVLATEIAFRDGVAIEKVDTLGR
jgi:hypothetical protein